MADAAIPSEVEAKLLVPSAAALQAVGRIKRLGRYLVRPRDSARLHSVYLDTAHLTLARHGVALRVRRYAGRWEATAKWEGAQHGDVHERPELTVPLPAQPAMPFALPAGPLRQHLAALVAGRPLAPILVSDIRRRRIDVLPPDPTNGARPLAELALDRVHLRAPSGAVAVTYYEAEVELVHGAPRHIATVARLLRQRFDLTPSSESKFSRGIGLLYGREVLTAGVPAPVQRTDTLTDAARKLTNLHLRRLRQHDPGTRLGEDPEALHDMRVACRRLRAAARAFDPGIPRQLHDVRVELKWLGQLLGGTRDLDVQLQLLERYAAALAPAQQQLLAGYRAHLEAERAAHRQEMLNGLDSHRYFRLLLRLEDFAFGRGGTWPRPAPQLVATAARAAIKDTFRRLLKRGRRMGPAPTDEELHALRIRAKRLRYLLEFLRDVTGKPGRRVVRQLVRLQDLLGSHHDAVVATASVHRYVAAAGASVAAPVLLALGTLIGEQQRVADATRGEFRKAWRRFSRERTLSDLDAVLAGLRVRGPRQPARPVVPGAPLPSTNLNPRNGK